MAATSLPQNISQIWWKPARVCSTARNFASARQTDFAPCAWRSLPALAEPLAPRPRDPAQALQPYDPSAGHGPWDARLAAHLLRRALTGPRPGEALALGQRTPAQAVDSLFNTENLAREDVWSRAGAALAAAGERPALAAWWLMKLTQEDRATGARLALFWHDHFACAQSKIGDLGFLHRQHETFMALGAGRFLDLLLAVARDVDARR